MAKTTGGLVGSLVGGILGGTVGFFAGGNVLLGASLGSALGGGIGGAIDAPDSGQIQNPELPSQIQLNTYHRNLPVPIPYGVVRVGGNMIWFGGIETRVVRSGGGKGKPETQQIFFDAKWAVSLGEGKIIEIGRVWVNGQESKRLVQLGKIANPALNRVLNPSIPGWSPTPQEILEPIQPGGSFALQLGEDQIRLDVRVYGGDQTQDPDPIIASIQTTNPPNFRNTAYLSIDGQLGQSPQIPQINCELAGIEAGLSQLTGIRIRYNRWADPLDWDFNHLGTTTAPAAAGSPPYPWWTERVTAVDATKLYAAHRSKTVKMSANEPWQIRFFTESRYVILNSQIIDRGFAIIDDSNDNLIQAFVLNATGFLTGGPGYNAAIVGRGSGYYPITSAFEYFRILDTDPNIRDFTTRFGAWWDIVFDGNSIVWRYLRTNFSGPSGTMTIDSQWQTYINHTLTQPEKDALALIADARFVIYGLGDATPTGTGNEPSNWIGHMNFEYTPSQPIDLVGRGNPALIVYDFLTNTRYGMGIPTSFMDDQSFASAAAYCDEDPSAGGLPVPAIKPPVEFIEDPFDPSAEPRFRLDILIATRAKAGSILQDMLATFRGFLVYDAGKIFLFIEQFVDITDPQVAHFSDNPASVPLKGLMVEDSFKFGEIVSSERPNFVRVEFERFDDQYRRDFAESHDPFDEAVRGKIERTVQLIGIKRQTQANRISQYLRDLGVNQRFMCQFVVSIAAMATRAGDVIKVSHTDTAWVEKGFRVTRVEELPNEELRIFAIEYIGEALLDQEDAIELAITQPIAEDLYVDPPNAIRFAVFEARDDPEPRLLITWSLVESYASFRDAFLFRRISPAGSFETLGQHVVNAVTARITHMLIGFDPAVVSGPPVNTIEITGDIIGGSAKVFDSLGAEIDSASESGGIISLDVTGETDPFVGHLEVYIDAAFASLAPNGRSPAVGTISLNHAREHTYRRTPFGAYLDDPTEVLIRSVIGPVPSAGDMYTAERELTYATFAADDDADKLQGVTWPLEPDIVLGSELENRVTNFKVVQVETLVYVERTSEFQTDAASGTTILPGIGDFLYIGADEPFASLHLALQTLASGDYGLRLTYSIGEAMFKSLGEVGTLWLDNTAGLIQSGTIDIEPPADWAVATQDASATQILDATARYWLCIFRVNSPTTLAIERLLHLEGGRFLTLQEPDNRVDHFYDQDEVGEELRFEPMVQNVFGATADAAARPGADWIIKQYFRVPQQVAALHLEGIAGLTAFIGGDLVITWLYVSRFNGAGHFGAGENLEGAGVPAITDAGFERYLVEIWLPDDSAAVRAFTVLDSGASGTLTYTEAQREADQAIGRDIIIKVYNQANGILSQPATLVLTAAGVEELPDIEDITSWPGTLFVNRMEEIDFDVALFPYAIDGKLQP